jgi:hypothetical protein
MQISGKPHEGWMTFIPLTVLLVVVIGALGGPTQFVNTVLAWLEDGVAYVGWWLRQL